MFIWNSKYILMLQNISDTFDKFKVPLLNKELHLFLYYKIKTYWPKMFEW